jgi:thiamine pyridinylase
MKSAMGTGLRLLRHYCPGILRSFAAAVLFGVLTTAWASAGELVLYNLSNKALTCSVDGYTKASGADTDLLFRLDPGQKLNIPPNFESKVHVINFVECGGLRTRSMNITPESPDRVIFLNGRQRRVLNTLLYAAIPTDPKVGFMPLVQWLTLSYQASHADVLVNLVLDPAIDVYSFANLKDSVLSAKGFDVAEIDTVFLKWLKDEGLISPARITGEEPWPVARQAVMLGGQAYGVPSWLCSDFLFSTTSDMRGIKTFTDLQSYMAKMPAGRRALVGDLDGTWTIPAAYIQAFVQSHAATTAFDAAAAPIDAAVITRMAKFGTWCAQSNTDPCIDGTFHNAKDGAVEQAFDAGYAANDMGFSERSFLLALYQQAPAELSLTAVPWGDQADAPKLAYSDAFVTSMATCGKEPCASDAAAFAAFMTSAATKKYVAMGSDLPGGDPPRHLIVATKPFYDDDDVKGDPVYTQIIAGFLKGKIQPYLTSFTPKLQYDLLSGICPVLQQQSPSWKCKIPKKPN